MASDMTFKEQENREEQIMLQLIKLCYDKEQQRKGSSLLSIASFLLFLLVDSFPTCLRTSFFFYLSISSYKMAFEEHAFKFE